MPIKIFYPMIDQTTGETKLLTCTKGSKLHQMIEQAKSETMHTLKATDKIRSKLTLFHNMKYVNDQAHRGLIGELDDIDNNMSFTITKDGIKRDK